MCIFSARWSSSVIRMRQLQIEGNKENEKNGSELSIALPFFTLSTYTLYISHGAILEESICQQCKMALLTPMS